jgi:hypothetical protein
LSALTRSEPAFGRGILDTNRYLALFEFGGGKGLIENIEEQKE